MSSEPATENTAASTDPTEPRYVDLHVHTNHSDGTLAPARTVEAAADAGLAAVAVTDHDTTSGVPEAIDAARRLGLEVVSGIELTAEDGQREMHILGYGIDPEHEELRAVTDRLQRSRFERARQMVERLAEIGIELDFDELIEAAGPGNIGRPHVARKIYELGAVGSVQEAFDRYIARHRPAYVDRWRISPRDALRIVHASGGLAVLAHPKLRSAGDTVPELVRLGLDGIEVYHTKHSPDDVGRYKAIADRYGLLKTGGSDCHGPSHGQPALIGSLPVPYSYFDGLKRRLANR